MKKRTYQLSCEHCGAEFTVIHRLKDAIGYCPFCGEAIEVMEPDDDSPLLKDFESMDEFDEGDYEPEEDE